MANSDEHRLWQEFATRPTAAVVLETGVFSLVMILALVGNLLVCGAVYKNPGLRCPSNYYIISLALSDMFQALFSMPLSIGMLATGRWPFTSSACNLMAATEISLSVISVYTMSAMAINRFYKIVKPAKYQTMFKKKIILMSASLIWILSIFVILLAMFAFNHDTKPHPGFAGCSMEFDGFIIGPAFIVVMFTPYFFMFFCYYKIYSFVKSHNSNISWQSANVEDVKIAKTLFITVIGFALLWLPAHVIFGVTLLKGFSFLPRFVTLIGQLLVYISSCVNPFIYGFMNRAFRKEFKKFLRLGRGHSIEAEPT